MKLIWRNVKNRWNKILRLNQKEFWDTRYIKMFAIEAELNESSQNYCYCHQWQENKTINTAEWGWVDFRAVNNLDIYQLRLRAAGRQDWPGDGDCAPVAGRVDLSSSSGWCRCRSRSLHRSGTRAVTRPPPPLYITLDIATLGQFSRSIHTGRDRYNARHVAFRFAVVTFKQKTGSRVFN